MCFNENQRSLSALRHLVQNLNGKTQTRPEPAISASSSRLASSGFGMQADGAKTCNA